MRILQNILINAFGLFTYTVYEGVICVDNDLRALTGVVIDAGHGGLCKIQKIRNDYKPNKYKKLRHFYLRLSFLMI